MSKTGKAANKENSKLKKKRGSRSKVEHPDVEEPSVKPKPARKLKAKVSFSDDLQLSKNSIQDDAVEEEAEIESDSQDESLDTKEIDKQDAFEQNELAPNWPQNDLEELIRRMEDALPEDDLYSYATRVGRLNWDEICFKDYTSEECKTTWLYIQKRIRRFRLLKEMLQDAKHWISKPWTNFYAGNKSNKQHPDMPKKPLSLYLRFYLKKKNKVFRENPGMEMTKAATIIAQMYRTLSPTKREKYLQQEAEERKEYIEKIEEFYRNHPDYPRGVEKKRVDNTRSRSRSGPKKPQTPFSLYYEEQLKTTFLNTKQHRDVLKVQCKNMWKAMPDTKKISYINKALDSEVVFQEQLKNYLNNNPTYTPGTRKPILNKEEKLLRQRVAGKPTKPPNSAYSLFSSEILKGEEIKKVDSKERLKEVAVQWKNCSETRKEHYRQEVNRLLEEYKQNFSNYLETLPEDQRQEELQNNLPKRKAPTKSDENSPVRKRKKAVVAVENVPKIENPPTPPTPTPPTPVPSPIPSPVPVVVNKYANEPVQPPVSAIALFSQKYSGKKSLKEAWKNLKKKDKAKLEDEVEKMKRQYLKEYVRFLKNLSKEELKEYKNMKTERDAAINSQVSIKVEKTENDDSDVESDSDNETSDINDDDDMDEDDYDYD